MHFFQVIFLPSCVSIHCIRNSRMIASKKKQKYIVRSSLFELLVQGNNKWRPIVLSTSCG